MTKKLRRSMLFLPGANAAMLSTAFVFRPDSIMFDLEDSVALREKDAARCLVYNALQHPLYADIETVVRVNPLDSAYGNDDLEAVIRGGVDAVRMPKTDSATASSMVRLGPKRTISRPASGVISMPIRYTAKISASCAELSR